MKLRGAIFDFDGTLFDSMSIWDTAGEKYLRSAGKTPEENLQQTLKTMSLRQSACYLRQRYALQQSVEEIMDGVNRTVEDFYFYQAQPKPGVMALLEELRRRGTALCIATATDRYQIDAALRRCGMDGFFREIFTCTGVGHGKDEPAIFEQALGFLGTQKEETPVFEDAFHGARTAKAAGFPLIGVYDAHESRQAELQALSDCYLRDFFRLEAFWQLWK